MQCAGVSRAPPEEQNRSLRNSRLIPAKYRQKVTSLPRPALSSHLLVCSLFLVVRRAPSLPHLPTATRDFWFSRRWLAGLLDLTPRISLIWYVLSSSLAPLSLRSFSFIVFSHSHRLRSVFDRYSYHNFQRSKTHLCVCVLDTGGAGTSCNSSIRRLDDF